MTTKKSKQRAKPAKDGRGGARVGAGRKRDRIPEKVVKALGAVPEDPKLLDTWVRRALGELVALQMRGEVSVDLAASIRTTLGLMHRAKGPTAPSGDDPDEPDDDDDDTEASGPDLTEVASDGSLRIEH